MTLSDEGSDGSSLTYARSGDGTLRFDLNTGLVTGTLLVTDDSITECGALDGRPIECFKVSTDDNDALGTELGVAIFETLLTPGALLTAARGSSIDVRYARTESIAEREAQCFQYSVCE